jgi:long-chain fatty acid transport protein
LVSQSRKGRKEKQSGSLKFGMAGRKVRMRRFLSVGFMLLLMAAAAPASGQEITQQVRISSSPNPVGSGARAVGMGGAFIAIADDATAASWNPGGLIQLERPELSIVGSYFLRQEDYSSSSHPEAATDDSFDSADLNYLSAVYPFAVFGHNMVVSLNFQRLYDFTKDIDFTFTNRDRIDATAFSTLTQKIRFEQDGGLKTISPAYCIQITPRFSLGATVNFWTDQFFENGWDEKYTAKGKGDLNIGGNSNPFTTNVRIEDEYSDLEGINFNIGFLWDLTPMITIGGVFKSPFTADLKHKKSTNISQEYTELPDATSSFSDKFKEDVEIDFPMSYGLGIAFRFSDAFTCALDIYRTEWGDFQYKDGKGNKTSPIDGRPASQSDIDPTHQVRLGAEYLLFLEKTIVPLRFGVFYDPQPAEGSPEDFYGFSLGSGVMIGPLILDAAYEYRFGNNVNGNVIGIPGTDADVAQHKILISAIYHF